MLYTALSGRTNLSHLNGRVITKTERIDERESECDARVTVGYNGALVLWNAFRCIIEKQKRQPPASASIKHFSFKEKFGGTVNISETDKIWSRRV